jgi:hypothetical protein
LVGARYGVPDIGLMALGEISAGELRMKTIPRKWF